MRSLFRFTVLAFLVAALGGPPLVHAQSGPPSVDAAALTTSPSVAPPIVAPAVLSPAVAPVPVPSVLSAVLAHWGTIAWFLGAWALVATFANRKWPRPTAPPAPAWQMWAHVVLIDWPAALPSLDMKGVFGLPVNVPFLWISTNKPSGSASAFLPFLLAVSVASSGCAQGLLGAKQGLANVQSVTASTIKGFESYDGQHQLELVAAAPTGVAAQALLVAYRAQRKAVVLAGASLNAAITAAQAAVVFASAPGAPAADFAAILGPVLKAATDLQAAIQALQKPAPASSPTSAITMHPPLISRVYLLHRREVAPHIGYAVGGGGVA